MAELRSSLVPDGYHWNGCGYCGSRQKGEDTSPSFYAHSTNISPHVYQGLVDRGWRRSGTTYYRPDLRNACCPHYSIRLDASRFVSSKAQRKAVNAFNKYISGSEYKRKAARLFPKTKTEKKHRKHVFDVCQRVHEAEHDVLSKPADPQERGVKIEPEHRLEVTLETDEMTQEKYALFANYQRNVHKEKPYEISERGFRNFLCSGLPRSTDESGKKLGSYHQCYRLDGELIAFGVLDLLPHAVSSVYSIYRDDVAHWQFGKLSALREIALALEGGYQWYYMGYYIHSCPKMKYKADYKPQFVLDPLTSQWHPLDQSYWNAVGLNKLVTYDDAESKWQVLESAQRRVSEEKTSNTIWDAQFVGIPTAQEIVETLPVSQVLCRVQHLQIDLENVFGPWDVTKIAGDSALLSLLAQLIACVGIDLAREITVDLSPYIRLI